MVVVVILLFLWDLTACAHRQRPAGCPLSHVTEGLSDVAEEYDSDAKSSGSGSDAEAGDADGDAMDQDSASDTEAKVERPKKKAKTGK